MSEFKLSESCARLLESFVKKIALPKMALATDGHVVYSCTACAGGCESNCNHQCTFYCQGSNRNW